ncbi:hypothetical protein FPV67DRAFT_1410807, partial [Lyophyllum atratum]
MLGDVPPELADLTSVEESLIALCHTKCWILHLKDSDTKGVSQRAVRGHVMVYPQNPGVVADILPPSIEQITAYMCIMFVGSVRPTDEWLREHATPLAVRANKVRRALVWLKAHNHLYSHITINESVLLQLPEDGLLDYHIELVSSSSNQESLVSGYEPDLSQRSEDMNAFTAAEGVLHSILISDLEGHASSAQLKAAAMRHIKHKGGDYLQMRRGSNLVNCFDNPTMFPMMYPTLYPYGIGGFDDSNRNVRISTKNHIKH